MIRMASSVSAVPPRFLACTALVTVFAGAVFAEPVDLDSLIDVAEQTVATPEQSDTADALVPRSPWDDEYEVEREPQSQRTSEDTPSLSVQPTVHTGLYGNTMGLYEMRELAPSGLETFLAYVPGADLRGRGTDELHAELRLHGATPYQSRLYNGSVSLNNALDPRYSLELGVSTSPHGFSREPGTYDQCGATGGSLELWDVEPFPDMTLYSSSRLSYPKAIDIYDALQVAHHTGAIGGHLGYHGSRPSKEPNEFEERLDRDRWQVGANFRQEFGPVVATGQFDYGKRRWNAELLYGRANPNASISLPERTILGAGSVSWKGGPRDGVGVSLSGGIRSHAVELESKPDSLADLPPLGTSSAVTGTFSTGVVTAAGRFSARATTLADIVETDTARGTGVQYSAGLLYDTELFSALAVDVAALVWGNDHGQSSFVPALNLRVRTSSPLTMYVGASTACREPSYAEQADALRGDRLGYEYSTVYRAGIDAIIGSRSVSRFAMSSSLSGFLRDVRRSVDWVQPSDDTTGVWASANLDQVRAYGVDAALNISATNGRKAYPEARLSLDIRYSWTGVSIYDDETIQSVLPDTAVNRSLNHRYGDDVLRHKLTVTAEASLFRQLALMLRGRALNRTSTQQWGVGLDAFLKVSHERSISSLHFGVENMFDNSRADEQAAGFTDPGRRIRLFSTIAVQSRRTRR